MSRLSLPCLTLLITLLFNVGCQTFKTGTSEQVLIESMPPGANVIVQGETVGQTPITLALPRKIAQSIRLERENYKPYTVNLYPVSNERENNLVKFGLAKEVGYYVSLTPNPVKANLVHELVPNRAGPQAYEDLTLKIIQVDDMRKAGKIDAAEHSYIVGQLIEVYQD
jgi:hypothetical protein